MQGDPQVPPIKILLNKSFSNTSTPDNMTGEWSKVNKSIAYRGHQTLLVKDNIFHNLSKMTILFVLPP